MKKKVLLIATGSFVLIALTALAKYVSNQAADEPAKARNMYFTSNLLAEREEIIRAQEKTYTISNWSAGENNRIKFDIRNYPDTQRFTSVPIKYELTVAEDPEAVIKINDETITTGQAIVLPASKNKQEQQKQSIEVYPTTEFLKDQNEATLTVNARSIEPYEKELQAQFKIQKAANGYQVVVEDESQSPYAKLIVWTNEKQNLKVQWKNDLVVPDQTNQFLIGKEIKPAADGVKKELEIGEVDAVSSATIYMMKYDEEQNYTAETNRPFAVEAID